MPVIYVRTKPGRKLFYEGKPIPLDNFVPVNNDPYIRRLIDHWGDLEEQGGSDKSDVSARKLKPTEKGPTAPVPGGGQKTIQPTGKQAPGTGAPRPRD